MFLAAAAPLLSLASGAIGAVGAVSSGIYQNQVAKNNAQVARWAADAEKQKGETEAFEADRKAAAEMGEQKAMQAASGLNIDSSSFSSVRDSSQKIASTNRQRIATNTSARVWGLNQEAQNMEAQGKAAQTAGFLEGAGSMLGGLSSFGSKWNSFKTQGIF